MSKLSNPTTGQQEIRRRKLAVLARWSTSAAATVAAWVLSYWIADGLLAMLSGFFQRSARQAPAAFGLLGAFFGFWFAYTG